MTCRNYISGPNGDCQRCGEMHPAASKPLNCDRDAQRWAREFIEQFAGYTVGGTAVDEGLMIAWFANAMMCGEDTYRWRTESETEPQRCGEMRAGHAGINQCDGCQRGLPMRYSRVSPSSRTPIHYDPDGGYAVMACTADLYK